MRLLVDSDLLWSERYAVSHDVFSIAVEWKRGLGGRGWTS